MAYKGKRSKLVGPWHDCDRCTFKWHIAELEWQRGLLLCPYCVDYGNNGVPLIGQREAMIAQAIQTFNLPDSTELQPDPKLTDVNDIISSMDDGIQY